MYSEIHQINSIFKTEICYWDKVSAPTVDTLSTLGYVGFDNKAVT